MNYPGATALLSSRPDLIAYATMVHQGVLTFEQASAVIESYGMKHDFDNPVPIDLFAALDQTCNVIHSQDDDEAIAGLLAGESVTDADDDELDIDGALSLWYGFQALLRSVKEG